MKYYAIGAFAGATLATWICAAIEAWPVFASCAVILFAAGVTLIYCAISDLRGEQS